MPAAILAGAGLTYKDLGKVEYLPFGESVELMKNRQLDATLQSAGLGVSSIRDLASSVPITVVEIPAASSTRSARPYVTVSIPANTYEGQTTDVPAAAVVNYLVTHSGMSDDKVYQMTKAIYESLPELAAAHAAAKDIKLEGALAGMPVPHASGRAEIFRRKGREEIGP